MTFIGEDVHGVSANAFRVCLHPQSHLGIDEVFHGSVRSFPSSSVGRLKSPGTVYRPTSRPTCRRSDGGNDTSLAMGVPRRAMMISSPAATRRKRREMWFLVSLTETYFMVPS